MKIKSVIGNVVLAVMFVLGFVWAGDVQAEGGRTGQSKVSSPTLQSVSIDTSKTPAELAGLLVGSEVTLSNISFTGDSRGSGYFSNGIGDTGLESGVILGSGKVIDVEGPNTLDYTTTEFGRAGDSDLNTLIPGYITYDATVLEFDFQCPESTEGEDVISFHYVFASEEYNEYVNSPYNDVFGFFLNGANIALLPDTSIPVSINNVNNGYSTGGGLPGTNPSNPAYYRNNDLNDGGGAIDIEADGLTVVLGAQANIEPGVNHIRLAIADAGDYQLDSWVFIEEGSFHCAPLNQPPTAEAGGGDTGYNGDEGSPISLDGSGSSDPDPGTMLAYHWTVDNPSLCSFDNPIIATPNLTCTDNGSFTVTLEVCDMVATDTDTATVTVNNVNPIVGLIGVDTVVTPINTPIHTTANFQDQGASDTHTATWDWGDGVIENGVVTQGAGSGSVAGSHSYASAGVYTVQLTVVDDDLGSGSSTFEYIVVYDPSAGFVTGGGWIESPSGAYLPDPTLTGKATFGFISKYLKGATVPTGNTEFQFHAAGMNFHSQSYEWLVVAGTKAQYKGMGTINGIGEYKFILWAGDGTSTGDADTFRIKIWTEDELGNELVVYDNGTEQAIANGNIVVHVKK